MTTTGTYYSSLITSKIAQLLVLPQRLIRPLKMVHKIERQLKLGIVDKAENGDLSFKKVFYLYYQSSP
jgi:hypothetical protein